MKKLAIGGLLVFNVTVAVCQDMKQDLLNAMGFEKMEVRDDSWDMLREVDKDPGVGSTQSYSGANGTAVNNYENETSQQGIFDKRIGDKRIELRLYKDLTGEYGAGKVNGEVMPVEQVKNLIDLFFNEMEYMPQEENGRKIYKAK